MKPGRIAVLLIAVLMLAGALCGCSTKTGKIDGISYEMSEDKSHAVATGCDKGVTEAVIASEYKGVPVTEIGEYAFFESGITSVTIPEGVTAIGSDAFSQCQSLASVSLPEGLVSIGDYSFRGCTALTNIKLPDSLTSIGSRAFTDSTALESIVIPDAVASIGDNAFAGCSALMAADMSGTQIKKLSDNLFQNAAALDTVLLPKGLEEIGRRVFAGCTSLAGIELPNGMTAIGEAAFDGCTSLSDISIPAGVTRLPYDVFGNCTAMKELYIPKTVTDIDEGAFSGNNGIVLRVESGSYAQSYGAEMKMNTLVGGAGLDTSTLYALIQNKTISVSISQSAINSGTITITNNSADAVSVVIPAGTYFVAGSKSYQNMLVTNPQTVFVAAGGTKTVSMSTCCMNISRSIPKDGVKYTVGELDSDALLIKVLEVLQERRSGYAVRQAAVWIVTDKATYSDTSVLTQNGARYISESNYKEAQSVVNEAKSR